MTPFTPEELARGVAAYARHEPRDSMYTVAIFLLETWWGDLPKMADALTVLLLTWNGAYYRYGMFDQFMLESCLRREWGAIELFRERNILSWSDADEDIVFRLFEALRLALGIRHADGKTTTSPVSAAKALHMLGPSFFPLWDQAIARAYECDYAYEPAAAYLRFCRISRGQAERVGALGRVGVSTLKAIDEYNYAKFTKGWI